MLVAFNLDVIEHDPEIFEGDRLMFFMEELLASLAY
jgi:hypothetical protein